MKSTDHNLPSLKPRLAAVLSMILLANSPLYAVSPTVTIIPENIHKLDRPNIKGVSVFTVEIKKDDIVPSADGNRIFTVEIVDHRDGDGMTVIVLATPPTYKDGKPQDASGSLAIYQGGKQIARCLVRPEAFSKSAIYATEIPEKVRDRTVVFSFDVTPEAINDSQFSIAFVNAASPGNMAESGGVFFQFHLQDFYKLKNPAPSYPAISPKQAAVSGSAKAGSPADTGAK